MPLIITTSDLIGAAENSLNILNDLSVIKSRTSFTLIVKKMYAKTCFRDFVFKIFF